jgi:hypothetical protein
MRVMAKHKKRKRREQTCTQGRLLSQKETSVTGEAANIIRRAQNRDARVVSLGPLVFFSTESGDAWMLGPKDGLAVCLARDGQAQPYTIVETDNTFGIDWQFEYLIEHDAFVVWERSGTLRRILGYPVREILRLSSSGRR